MAKVTNMIDAVRSKRPQPTRTPPIPYAAGRRRTRRPGRGL